MTAIQNTPGFPLGKGNAPVAEPQVPIVAAQSVRTLDEISKDGTSVKLERRAMQLLLYLSKHADQVVSVEQLLDEVWVGVVVTPDSVYHAVAALRRLLGDDTGSLNFGISGAHYVAPQTMRIRLR
jgi:DNA-binding winged helix-turn-helix (wHTH) protein